MRIKAQFCQRTSTVDSRLYLLFIIIWKIILLPWNGTFFESADKLRDLCDTLSELHSSL